MLAVLILSLFIGLAFAPYAVFQFLYAYVFKPQNLREKYGAKWGVVTGASSGIGKSLAWKLASQGVSVVLVALPEKILDETTSELESAFPEVQIRKVGVDLGDPASGYLNEIDSATKDLDVRILFCNAGYMLTGFFHKSDLAKQMANINCNVGSSVQITHHFLQKMVEKNLKGCIVYTSSPAALMPGPFSALYASTKRFISSFGASIAAEIKSCGIDVLVFHPSPVATRFYDNQKKIDALEFFKRAAVHPDTIPDMVFKGIGRTVWQDIGITTIVFRIISKLVDFNALATLTAFTAHTMPDYKRHIT